MKPVGSRLLAIACLAGAAGVSSCGIFGSSESSPPAAPADGGEPEAGLIEGTPKNLSAKAAPLRVARGTAKLLDVTVTRLGSDAPVDLSVLALPPGVTAKPATIPRGQTTGQIEVFAALTAVEASKTKIVVTAAMEDRTATAETELYITGAPGQTDTTFGTAGVSDALEKELDAQGHYGRPFSVVVQPDGRITVGLSAYAKSDGLQHLAVARLMENGQLDPAFGTKGIAIVGDNQSFLYGHLVLGDGKILLYGNQQFGGGYHAVVARLDAQGKLDPGFGGNPKPGVKRLVPNIDPSDVEDVILSAAISKVGNEERIIVVGKGGAAQYSESWSARLLPSGEYDPTYNGGAVLKWTEVARLSSVVVAPDNAAYVCATSFIQTNPGKWIARLDPAGARDVAFGNKAFTSTAPPNLGSIALTAQNTKLVVAGDSNRLARYSTAGVSDTTFTPSYPADQGSLKGIANVAEDKILIVGRNADPGYVTVARLLSSGVPDSTFGSSGVRKVELGIYPNEVAFGVTPDGRIIVASDSITQELKLSRLWD